MRKKYQAEHNHGCDNESKRRLEMLVEMGDVVAMYYLGKLYEDSGSIDKAISYYIRSIKKSSLAMKRLGVLKKLYPSTYYKVLKNQ